MFIALDSGVYCTFVLLAHEFVALQRPSIRCIDFFLVEVVVRVFLRSLSALVAWTFFVSLFER